MDDLWMVSGVMAKSEPGLTTCSVFQTVVRAVDRDTALKVASARAVREQPDREVADMVAGRLQDLMLEAGGRQ